MSRWARLTPRSSSTCGSRIRRPRKSGTGCVHTAPGHGPDDFHIGKEYGLEIYCPVDNAGNFFLDIEHFGGENMFKANPKIVEFLRESGMLVAFAKITSIAIRTAGGAKTR